ncbi:MAG: PrsW family intramembrane metalloprotease [Chloroflexi bacterium]|nr:MAG: PrsW family intramembrane metalloprotease [Chloroflexota bacterium]TMG12102.1 MAG: PrsW family intramembrane metalloprotease [Chloroflexota bacterium]
MDTREDPPIVTCPHCGANVPAGEFCGLCGAHLATGSPRRSHAYAAVPNQRVAHLAIVSTLFPHLAYRRSGPFRVAIVAGGALVVMLAALHLFAPATVAAVFLLPVLYLMYLYEVEVYEDEPWLVVGATMVLGALLGLAFANVAGVSLSQLDLTGDRESAFVLAALAIPIVAQLLMLAGPAFLYTFRARFREPLDGVTFGAASGLGFSLASSLTAFWPLITGPLVANGSPIDWAIRLTRAGLLIALINACTTALIAAALWLHRYDTRRGRRPIMSSLLGALVIALGVQIMVGVIGAVVGELLVGVVLLAAISIVLLLYVRVVIHDALLVEGAEHGVGPEAPCPECHRMVPTMAFCPACGAARAAGTKQGRARLAGGV